MIKMLFQGDSITDAGRDRSDCHNLAGYPALVAEKLRKLYPQEEFEFIDLGISGDRSAELVKRYDLTDWKIDGARTGKTICTNYYRSNIYNSPLYFHKEVSCLTTEIYSTKRKDEIQDTVKSRLVISVSGE